MDSTHDIVADANIPALDETFGRHGRLRRVDGRSLDRAGLGDAGVLLVRSVTRVDARLLAGSRVRFVGTATIGTDHLDTGWLGDAGIAWAAAPGCNADAAAQYTLATMLLACQRLGRDFRAQTVGIIGRGQVGARLQALLSVLGLRSVANDPPRAAAGEAGLVPLREALAQDIISLHVPLTLGGQWPTRCLIDRHALAGMRRGALLVNAARGDVVEGPALKAALQAGQVHAALDTWPGEPHPDPELLAACTVATPHVAGYSLDGRLNGTAMVYAAWCTHAGIPPGQRGALPPPVPTELSWPPAGGLDDFLLAAARVREDDAALRAVAARPGLPDGFDALRRDYRWRRDWSGCRVPAAPAGVSALLTRLGFAPT